MIAEDDLVADDSAQGGFDGENIPLGKVPAGG
jgi:hypothetical protein